MSSTNDLLLVTGANGYIGTHIIKQALEKGYRVRGTLRSESAMAALASTFPEYKDQLSFALVSDMTNPESYAQAMEGVTGIIHTASPFILNPEDNVRDLLIPARDGAVGILEAAKRYGPSVRRVINTSSFAANLDMTQGYRPGYVYSEKDWNPTNFDEAAVADAVTAYCASKGIAERAMWDWMEANKNEVYFSLTSLSPPWVFGPSVSAPASLDRLNESTHALWSLVGADSVPPTDFAGFVDVRDLAAAHITAYESPEAAGQRFLIGSKFSWQIAADAILAELPELSNRIPKGTPGAGNTEKVYSLDSSKVQKVLGVEFTPVNVTVRDSIKQLLEVEKRTASASN
ncbi:NAD dependent epimerase/dehydratase [Thozetella sp. PMI_491]|nr:NAD dependent epimerase/dehydratase [Thozetella sp. PMI_491]